MARAVRFVTLLSSRPLDTARRTSPACDFRTVPDQTVPEDVFSLPCRPRHSAECQRNQKAEPHNTVTLSKSLS